LKAQLDELAPPDSWVVLHGSPHSYNVLVVGNEPVFIDLESTCFGPVEWDVAHLAPAAGEHAFQSARAGVIELCRNMVQIKTAALCAAEIDRGDMRAHAKYHLAAIKQKFGQSAR
jgi:hypothetical protein